MHSLELYKTYSSVLHLAHLCCFSYAGISILWLFVCYVLNVDCYMNLIYCPMLHILKMVFNLESWKISAVNVTYQFDILLTQSYNFFFIAHSMCCSHHNNDA